MPGAEAVLADLTTSFTSFRVCFVGIQQGTWFLYGYEGYTVAEVLLSHAVAVGVFDVAGTGTVLSPQVFLGSLSWFGAF